MKRAKIIRELRRLKDVSDRQPTHTIPVPQFAGYKPDYKEGHKAGYKEALRDLLITVSKGKIRNFLDVNDK